MLVSSLRASGLRNLAIEDLGLGEHITVLWGPNGAGKTTALEALCLALTGRSCRTRVEREAIAFGQPLARAEVVVREGAETREFLWSMSRDGERRHLVDGTVRSDGAALRPALAIFLPDRLALVKGPPGGRREHVDRLCGALWPARGEARGRYGRALAQRNALLGRVRAGAASAGSLDAWDRELAAAGIELIDARRRTVAALDAEFAAAAGELGLAGGPTLRYMPRSAATDPDELASELCERRESDVARGFSGHGPHLDELDVALAGRSLRRYGSQGEQRTALLALLFAERRALLEARSTAPLMLLDDVMSELDPNRRALLSERLREGGGQAVVTATEPDQVPAGFERTEIVLRHGEAVGGHLPGAVSAGDHADAPLAA